MTAAPNSPSNDRQAQLVAAARALRTWVNEQRDTWPDRPASPAPALTTPRPIEPVRAAVEPVPAIRQDKSEEKREAKHKDKRKDQRKEQEREKAKEKDRAPLSIAPAPVREIPAAPAPVDPIAVVPDEPEDEGEGANWMVRGGLGVAAAVIVAVMGYVGWNAMGPAEAPAPKTGTAVLESVPPGSDVFVDGTPAGKAPVTKELEAGRHMVEFRRRTSSRKLQVEVVAGKTTRERLDWTAKRKGSLEILTEPDGASVSVDGTPRGVTPLTIDDLTVGTHSVLLESNSGSLKRTVTISADTVAQITEAIYSGWLHVSSPIELRLAEGSRALQLDERNQVMLSPGSHDLVFENAALGYRERRRVEVKPGRIAEVTIAPAPSMLSVTASLPAEVFVDGVRVGEAPLTNHAIEIGTRLVVVKSITGPERRFTITATGKPNDINVDFSKP